MAADPTLLATHVRVVVSSRCGGRGRFWSPNSLGYTDRIEYAGLYPPGDSDTYTARPLSDFAEELEAAKAEAIDRYERCVKYLFRAARS